MENYLTESLVRYIGQTVTIFTTSGGISGSGFTGVLVSVNCGVVKLITDVGGMPACPCGSACGGLGGVGNQTGCADGKLPVPFNTHNWLGSITEIPVERIAGFTHNAI